MKEIIVRYSILAVVMMACWLSRYLFDVQTKKDKWDITIFLLFILAALTWPISYLYIRIRPMIAEKKIIGEHVIGLGMWIILLILTFG